MGATQIQGADQTALDRERTSQSPVAALQRLVAIIRRRWVIVACVLFAVPAAAVGFSLSQEELYEGDATVLLTRQNLANSLTGTPDPTSQQADFPRILQTQAELAKQRAVVQRVVQALPGARLTPEALLRMSNVSPDSDADLLRFSVVNQDPQLAIRLAGEYATQFTAYRRRLDTAAVQRARVELQQRIAVLDSSDPGDRGLLDRLLDTDEELRTLEALQTSNAFTVGRSERAAQIQPNTWRNAIVGLVFGLALAIGIALLVDALDTRVRNPDEIGDLLGLPLLGRLSPPPRELAKNNQLLMLADPRSPPAEAFRLLRTAVDFANVGRHAKTIMVSSAMPAEGKSTTVANLAVTMARLGRRIVLVDLDLRRPGLQNLFDLPVTRGITGVALGETTLDQALVDIPLGTSVSGSLQVLTTGPIPPDPGEFVQSDTVARMLRELNERADIVLIDTPPILLTGDAIALSESVDGVVLVTRLGVVRRPMLTELRRLVVGSPVAPLGFVITNVRDHVAGGYGYYGYGTEIREEDPAMSAGPVSVPTR